MSRGNNTVLQRLWRNPSSRLTPHLSLVRWALLPLAMFYGWTVRLRTALYETGRLSRRRLPCRVVSVGNLTAGGTGKTPVVIAVAEWLTSEGKRVGVLSRGYRRTSQEKYLLVSDGVRVLAGPGDAGDEPYLIAKRCPGVVVAVGADRYGLGRWVLEQFPLDCLLLDDGFQHLALYRDVDLVLMDASDTTGILGLLPAGRLREPVAAGARADAVLVTRVASGSDTTAVSNALRGIKLKCQPYPVQFKAESLVHVGKGVGQETEFVRGRAALAVSAVGNPDSFRALLQSLGVRVQEELRFPDHHAYTAEDVARIRACATQAGAELILTTEKDAGKLEALIAEHEPIWAVRLRTEMIERGEDLKRLILGDS